jgi:hypothetical protein
MCEITLYIYIYITDLYAFAFPFKIINIKYSRKSLAFSQRTPYISQNITLYEDPNRAWNKF